MEVEVSIGRYIDEAYIESFVQYMDLSSGNDQVVGKVK